MVDYQSTGRSLELLSFTIAAAGRGESYAAGTLFQGVANGNTKKVYIDNSGNDTDIVILTPNVASNGQVHSNAVANPTEDTQGDTATVQTVSTSGNGLTADVRTAGDNETGVLSGGDAYPQVTVGGGTGGSSAALGSTTSPAQIAAIVEAGDTWSVEVSNQKGNASDISITLTLAEVENNTV
jgi:hypothetical protein